MTQTLDQLRTDCGDYPGKSPEYVAKQLHRVPDAPVVVRETFLLSRCAGRVVLDIGASGPMHAAIVKASRKCYGLDRQDGAGVVGIDLDDCRGDLPIYDDVQIVVCGEVLEHLSNPGQFLDKLRHYHCQTIFTVPNAFTAAGRKFIEHGTENVNLDHVAWYSWRTIKTLLSRHGYEIKEFAWYKGEPRLAEGLIVVSE